MTSYFTIKEENILENRNIDYKVAEFLGIVPKEKPLFIKSYNNNMNGVDVLDQKINYYSLQRKSNRWTYKFSMYLIDLLMFNSYVLYKENSPKNEKLLSFLEYRLKAIEWFCSWTQNNSESISVEYNTTTDSNAQDKNYIGTEHKSETDIDYSHNNISDNSKHFPITRNKRTTCFYCYKTTKKIIQTVYYCEICKNGYCINKKRKCWFLHHLKNPILQVVEDNDSFESSE